MLCGMIREGDVEEKMSDIWADLLDTDRGELDPLARKRLAQVAADPNGEAWLEAAGLLATDSCGYPVEGGYYDVKSELAAAAEPDRAAQALQRLLRQWAEDYVTSGSARLDRAWREFLG